MNFMKNVDKYTRITFFFFKKKFHTLSNNNVFSLQTFQDFIRSINRYTVWIHDANHNIVEFSPEIKVMFMKVASIVARIHLNGQCAGDLINRIRIYGDLSVSFPFPNKSIDGDITLVDRIFTDLLHFRRMVAEVIISTIPNFDVEIPFYVKPFSRRFSYNIRKCMPICSYCIWFSMMQTKYALFFNSTKNTWKKTVQLAMHSIFSVVPDFHFMHGLGDFLVTKDLLRRHFFVVCIGITLQRTNMAYPLPQSSICRIFSIIARLRISWYTYSLGVNVLLVPTFWLFSILVPTF